MLVYHILFHLAEKFVIAFGGSYLNRAKDSFFQYHGKKVWKSLGTRELFLSSASRPSTIHYRLFARGKHPCRKAAGWGCTYMLQMQSLAIFFLKCWWKLVCAKTADFALRHVQVLHPARPAVAGTGQTEQLEGFCLQQPQRSLPGCLCPCPWTERVGKLPYPRTKRKYYA